MMAARRGPSLVRHAAGEGTCYLDTLKYPRGRSSGGRFRVGTLDHRQRLFIGHVQLLGFGFGQRMERGREAVHAVRMALPDLGPVGVLDLVLGCRRREAEDDETVVAAVH